MDLTPIAQQAGVTESEAAFAVAGAMLGGATAVIAVIAVVYYIICVIANWKIFTKAGEAGWKSIIPFYNAWVEYKFTWDVRVFFVALVLAIVVGLGQAITNPVFAVIAGLASIGVLVLNIMENYKLSKCFGHGAGFTVGLLFLPFIFRLILAFGNSQYVGHPV